MKKSQWKKLEFEITITVDGGNGDPAVLSYRDWETWTDSGILNLSDHIEASLKNYREENHLEEDPRQDE